MSADTGGIIVPTNSNGRNTTLRTGFAFDFYNPIAKCTVTPTFSMQDSAYVEFSGEGSAGRNGAAVVSYSWTFDPDDQGSAEGIQPPGRWYSPDPGTFIEYRATLTVTDEWGATGSASCAGRVYSPYAPPCDTYPNCPPWP